MATFLEEARAILRHDLDPDFLESAAIAIAWEYSKLFEELELEKGLTDDCRREEFNKRRGDCVRNALARVAKQHGMPFELRRLSANGQHKILIRAGRVILVQETIEAREDHPHASDYKRDLADAYGFVRQLGFDFGDRPYRVRNWSGCILAVLLHGPASVRFTRDGMTLGNLMLGVPDAAYQQWVLRLDLYDLAMFGRRDEEMAEEPAPIKDPVVQADEVVVKPKKRNRARETAKR